MLCHWLVNQLCTLRLATLFIFSMNVEFQHFWSRMLSSLKHWGIWFYLVLAVVEHHIHRIVKLSLVGEPIMYSEISNFVHLLHERGISTFLVTNAQFPKALRYLVLSCNSCNGAPHSQNCQMWAWRFQTVWWFKWKHFSGAYIRNKHVTCEFIYPNEVWSFFFFSQLKDKVTCLTL